MQRELIEQWTPDDVAVLDDEQAAHEASQTNTRQPSAPSRRPAPRAWSDTWHYKGGAGSSFGGDGGYKGGW